LTTLAQFLATDTELVGGWLRSQHDVWGLGEWEALRKVLLDEAAGVYHPSRNRASGAVNLTEWYAMDSTLDVKINTGNAAITDATLATPESVASLVASLDQKLPTEPVPAQNEPIGCSEIGMLLARTDGLAFGLTYDALTNKLIADGDGFSVQAPEAVASLLGVVPYTEGECYIPPIKQSQ
jgi:hypothetical protein